MRRVTPAAGLLLVGVVLAAAGCGGGAKRSPLELVQAAASKTRSYGSVRFRAVFDLKVTGGGGNSLHLAGSGVAVDHGRVLLMHAMLDDPSAGLSRLPMTVLLGEKTTYVRYESAGLAALMPRGKRWILLTGGPQAPELGQNDPAQLVSYLESTSDVRLVGTETVDGTSASHFAGSIVLAKVRQRAAAAGASLALFDSVAAIGVKKIPIDAWIDGRGLLRRIRAELHVTNPQNASQTLSLLESTDFSDYGVRANVHLPSSRQVITLKQFERRAAGK
jgi:hypothetical protein